MSGGWTPGPWVCGNTAAYETMIIGRGGEGDYICHVTIEQCGGGAIASAMEPARRANARLIAAAPELYEALEALVSAVNIKNVGTALHSDIIAARVGTALAALAKATGA